MLHHPSILGDPQIKEDKIRIGPQVSGNARSPLHSRGFPNKGGQNQNWPTSGRKCYITPAFSGIPKQTGTKSELAHKWAEMLHHPYILRDPQTNGDRIRIGPQVGGNSTSPLRSRGSPNKGGQNQGWPTSGRKCYNTRAFLGIPKQQGTKSEVARKWAEMLYHPCSLGDPQIKEDEIRIGPQVGGNATSPLHSRESPNKGGQNQNWPTSGRKCYITPAFLGIPKQRGTESELAHKWAEMLHLPCILGGSPTKGDKIRIGPPVGGNATSPLRSRGFPNKRRQNQSWPTSGRKFYITPAFSGIPK